MPMTTDEISRLINARKMSGSNEVQDIIFLAGSPSTRVFQMPYREHSFAISLLGLLPAEAQCDELSAKEMLLEKDALSMEMGMFEIRYHELFNTDDIAQCKGVDRRTITRWRARGLDGYKFGQEIFSKRSDLESWNPGF
jgi:hypothetical protein